MHNLQLLLIIDFDELLETSGGVSDVELRNKYIDFYFN
jgi:hypothetical protein